MRALLLAGCLPLGAQTYDLRFEVPFPQGQSLSAEGDQRGSGSLDTGRGGILGLERTFLEWPVLRLSAGVEATRFRQHGSVVEGSTHHPAQLTQLGFGVGLQAQFWFPFVGAAGEMGILQRFQRSRYEAAGILQRHDLSRTWVRVGARWRLPFRSIRPYLAVSYQEPLRTEQVEVRRLWTLGIGATF